MTQEEREEMNEEKYPCTDYGALRSEAQGGKIFTVCDKCWNKHYRKLREGRKS